MELVKNIFFNTDRLVQDTPLKISYAGDLFQKDSKDIFIGYGCNSNSDGFQTLENVKEVGMEKTDLGFQLEIKLQEKDYLNFYFKNEKGEIDNNNGENYIFKIEPKEKIQKEVLDLVVVGEKALKKRRLKRSYILNKKIRLAIYKIIMYVPKIISGNYTRKIIS